MIVRDEAAGLGACLAGAAPLVGEMVVVDTGSVDGTMAIAEGAGARVVEWAWRDDFSAARNVSLEHATGDWILILDGDEVLDESAQAAIRALDLSPKAPPAYAFEVVNYATDRHDPDEATLQRQVRLFRNHPQHRYRGHVHNQLVHLGTGVLLPTVDAAVRVHHYGYTPTVWARQNKDARLGLLEKAVAQQPGEPFVHFNLANHLKILGRYEEALKHYAEVHARCPLPADGWGLQARVDAAFCAHQIGRNEDSIGLCDAVLEHHPELADAHLRRAEALLALGRPRAVVEPLRALLRDPRRRAIKQAALAFGVPYRLGLALFQARRPAEAAPLFVQLAGTGTRDLTVYTHLALCMAQCGRPEAAHQALDLAAGIDPADPDVAKLREALPPDPLDALRKAAKADTAEAHNRLAVALHQRGRLGEALGHFTRAVELAPDEVAPLNNLLEACWGTGAEVTALLWVERALLRALGQGAAVNTFYWDFYGPDAERIAAHFQRHLDAYIEREALSDCETRLEQVGTGHHAAVCAASEGAVESIVGALRPHRRS